MTMVVIMVMEMIGEVDDLLPEEVQVEMEMGVEEVTPLHHLTKGSHNAIDTEEIDGCT